MACLSTGVLYGSEPNVKDFRGFIVLCVCARVCVRVYLRSGICKNRSNCDTPRIIDPDGWPTDVCVCVCLCVCVCVFADM